MAFINLTDLVKDKYTVAISLNNELKSFLLRGQADFILLGFKLKEAKTFYNYLPGCNYKNLYEYADSELHLCKTNVKYYINVHTRFSNPDHPLKIKDEYKEYLYSQLREMVSMSDNELLQVNPTMTCDDIKKLKKKLEKVDKSEEQKLINSYMEVSFKNKQERIDFLDKYTEWKLINSIDELYLKFYRAKMSNGSYIYATESMYGKSPMYDDYYFTKPSIRVLYSVVIPGDKDNRYNITGDGGVTGVEKYISSNKLKYIKE